MRNDLHVLNVLELAVTTLTVMIGRNNSVLSRVKEQTLHIYRASYSTIQVS